MPPCFAPHGAKDNRPFGTLEQRGGPLTGMLIAQPLTHGDAEDTEFSKCSPCLRGKTLPGLSKLDHMKMSSCDKHIGRMIFWSNARNWVLGWTFVHLKIVGLLSQSHHSCQDGRAMHRFNMNNTYLNRNMQYARWWRLNIGETSSESNLPAPARMVDR